MRLRAERGRAAEGMSTERNDNTCPRAQLRPGTCVMCRDAAIAYFSRNSSSTGSWSENWNPSSSVRTDTTSTFGETIKPSIT